MTRSFEYRNDEFPLVIDGETVAFLDLSCEISIEGGVVEDVSYIWLNSALTAGKPVRVSAKYMLHDAIVDGVTRMVDEGRIEVPDDVFDVEIEDRRRWWAA